MSWHKCRRYWELGVYCPFQVLHGLEERDDDDEEEPYPKDALAPIPIHRPTPPRVERVEDKVPFEEPVKVEDPYKIPAEKEIPKEMIKAPPLKAPAPPVPLPIPLLPGPQEEEDESPRQVPEPAMEPEKVGVEARFSPAPVMRMVPLPDRLLDSLKKWLGDRGTAPVKGSERGSLPVVRATGREAPGRPSPALAQGIYMQQKVNERAYARGLAEASELDFVRGLQEQIARNERVANDEGFFEELGAFGAAVVAAAGITYGMHVLRKGLGGPPAGGRPPVRSGGYGGFIFQAPTFQRATGQKSLGSCSWCSSTVEGEVSE